jgi:hypothetical protein
MYGDQDMKGLFKKACNACTFVVIYNIVRTGSMVLSTLRPVLYLDNPSHT